MSVPIKLLDYFTMICGISVFLELNRNKKIRVHCCQYKKSESTKILRA